MTPASQTKYDVELISGGTTMGFMCARTSPDFDVDYADPDPNDRDSEGKAGISGSKNQRAMPCVSISDFRGGQGQRVLDRPDASPSAFRSGRHLNCEVEGEVSLAQGMITVLCEGIENVICEANGTVWAAFTPDEEEPLDPRSVRWLSRVQLTLTNPLTADPEALIVAIEESEAYVEKGDFLYLPDGREVLLVTDTAAGLLCERAAGLFDNGDGLTQPRAHEANAAIYAYGWRSVPFTPVAATPNEHVPVQHVRSMTSDGQKLYVAFSDGAVEGSGGGYLNSIWSCPTHLDEDGYPDDPHLTLHLHDVGYIQQLEYSLGWLYYATSNQAGYVGYEIDGESLALNQLSLTKVVGEVWDDDHSQFVEDERKVMAPEVDSVGLVNCETWVYWLTNSGRDSWLYKVQAPVGFELVHPFSKGFRATCITSSYGNVYVGGYFTKRDAFGPGEHAYEGAVYLFKSDIAERIVTLDQRVELEDTRIKGLTAVGQLISIATNTQLYQYSVKSGGYWHAGTLPPRDFTNRIIPTELVLWDWDYSLLLDKKPTETPAVWEKVAGSDTLPKVEVLKDQANEEYLNINDKNGRYIRYGYKTSIVSDNLLVEIQLADTAAGATQRRALEVGLRNGKREARYRVTGAQKGDVWKFSLQMGKWNTNRNAWQFDDLGWWDSRDPDLLYFQLTERGAFCWMTEAGSDVRREGPPMVPAEKLRKQTGIDATAGFWWGGGIKIGDAIVYDNAKKRWIDDTEASINRVDKFRCAVKRVRFTADDLSPRRYMLAPSEGVGAVAELDGEVFIPLQGSAVDVGMICFTRNGETYTGANAFVETSDSYQDMGTAYKYYRRFEISLPALLDEQSILGMAYIDDQPQMVSDTVSDPLFVEGEGSGGDARGQTLFQKVINESGIKSRVKVEFMDLSHRRADYDRLKINSIGVRYMASSSPLKHSYTFDCGDKVECRDGTYWDVSADTAVNFVKMLKKSGSVVTLKTDEGLSTALVDAFRFSAAIKDENALSAKQGSLQVVLRIVDE